MSFAVQHSLFTSADDFLSAEEVAEGKHEFLNGVVYALAGARQRHNELAMNIAASLHAQLRGRKCRAYGSDMMIKVEHGSDLRFYYPDVSVICQPAGPEARVQTEPTVIFEVLSASTARIDTGEKRLAYLTIPSMEACVLVDADKREVTLWQREAATWQPQVLTALDSRLTFPNAGCALTLAEIYQGTGL